MKEECSNCKYRKRGWLKDPCATGAYQLKYSNRCFGWKQSLWSKLFKK